MRMASGTPLTIANVSLSGHVPTSFDGFLREACPSLDLDWRRYRRRDSRRRVERRLRGLGLSDLGEYLERLRSDAHEAETLADRMRVTVSRFFRERATWSALGHHVLPRLAGQAAQGRIRAWSVGCCGGRSLTVWLWRGFTGCSHATPTTSLR